jgi:dipeptidase
MPNPKGLRVACDSLVALRTATRGGGVLFAKNSDRPAFECQPLVQTAARSFPAGSRLRCTYIDIPQVARTARVIGSRPYWCWGFEHGLNEHGVAIGNHTVFTKDELAGLGLIGMDIVRLGLERARTAPEALEEMTRLIETYGQGGSGYADKDWPYHNSFLIADRRSAFLLETSDKRWAVREIADVGSASNHLTIGSDWTALSDGIIEHAVDRGWWPGDGDARFDFAAAYRDTSVAPDVISSGRHRRTCSLLEQQRGSISVDSLKRALRDHYDLAAPGAGRTPMDAEYFSVCMHAEPVGTTTASMIASLPADGAPLYFASLGSPCAGAFLPLFIDAEVPESLARGGEAASEDSPWWEMKQLVVAVERDWTRNLPRVRAEMDRFETAAQAEALGLARAATAIKNEFMRATLDALLGLVRRLRDGFQS